MIGLTGRGRIAVYKWALGACASVAAIAPAMAQQSASGDGNADIIVTALKRDTRLQETPISISAVTADTIANSGVQDVSGLGSSVPSLNFVDAGPSFRRVVIRGIQAAGEPTVGLYYDETPVTGVIGATADAGGSTPELRMFDVDRVEVLRGPQGTLYGSGSMGGTLRVIYKKPSDELEGALDASLSTTEHGTMGYEAQGMVNVPVVENVLALRAVGYYKRAPGWVDNSFLHVNNINKADTWGGRLAARVHMGEAVTLDLSAFHNESENGFTSWTVNLGPYNTDRMMNPRQKDVSNLYSGVLNVDLDWAKMTAVVSHMDRSLQSYSDQSWPNKSYDTLAFCNRFRGVANCDTAPELAAWSAYVNQFVPAALAPHNRMKNLTSELRLASQGSGALNWTFGVFFMERDTRLDNPLVLGDAKGQVIQPLQLRYLRTVHDKLQQTAFFGELSFDVTPQFNLTAGARYFNYNKKVGGATPIGFTLVNASAKAFALSKSKEDGVVLKFNGSYKITPDVMFYAEAAQGFRPGGVNQTLGLPDALAPYNSDRLWNYEAGFKTSWLDRKLTFNVDAFRIDWSNMQLTASTPDRKFSYITNAGKARIKGIETELFARPAPGLEFNANATWLDAKLVTNQANALILAPGLKGDRIPFIPKFTFGAGAQYRTPLSEAVSLFMRADYSHGGGFYSDFRPADVATRYTPKWDLVNARIGIEGPDNDWGVYAYVTNLFDKIAYQRLTAITGEGPARNWTNAISAQPRTWGMNVRKRF